MVYQKSGKRAIIGVIAFAILFFSWGLVTVRFQVFPYVIISGLIPSAFPEAGLSSGEGDAAKERVAPEQEKSDRYWAERLKQGGYILHFRHAQREKWHDVQAFDAYELKKGIQAEGSDFSRAVCLTPQGIEEAKLIGAVFEMTGVRVSRIISSPSCRSRQTALHAFGRWDEVSNSLLHRTAIMQHQHEPFARELRKLIDRLEHQPGKNIVLSGHGGTLKTDGEIVVDDNRAGDLDRRNETGFVILEKSNGKVIAHHLFNSIKEFTLASIELPLQ